MKIRIESLDEHPKRLIVDRRADWGMHCFRGTATDGRVMNASEDKACPFCRKSPSKMGMELRPFLAVW